MPPSGHRRPELLLGTLFCALISSGCVHAPRTTKGFESSPTTSSVLEDSLRPRRLAIVIGIDEYDDPTFGRLRFARRDAVEMARVLRNPDHGGFDRVVELTAPDDVTRRAILEELRRLRNGLRRQDTLLIYFSGHGSIEVDAQARIRLYLVTTDTRASDLAGTAIDVAALRRFLKELKAQRKVLILDNCFSGSGKSRISATSRAYLSRLPDPWRALEHAAGQTEAVLMASTLGGSAEEDNALRHGTYTYFLLQGLTGNLIEADANGDGAVTAYEAHDYARARTVEHTHGRQVPEGNFRVVGRADVFLSGKPDPELARAAALVYAYGATSSAMSLEVDGRRKGAFPRTVSIPTGVHEVRVQNSDGRVVAQGRLAFAEGQVYSLGLLIEELRGYRRFFALESGYIRQLTGEATGVWGRDAPRVGVVSGYRMRGGALRGLTLSFHAGWSTASDGAWTVLADVQRRNVLDLGVHMVMRRSRGRWQGGAGWFASLVYVPALDLPDQVATNQSLAVSASQGWLSFPGGPVVWAGMEMTRNVLLTLEATLPIVGGDFDEDGDSDTNVQARLAMGLELGF